MSQLEQFGWICGVGNAEEPDRLGEPSAGAAGPSDRDEVDEITKLSSGTGWKTTKSGDSCLVKYGTTVF